MAEEMKKNGAREQQGSHKGASSEGHKNEKHASKEGMNQDKHAGHKKMGHGAGCTSGGPCCGCGND